MVRDNISRGGRVDDTANDISIQEPFPILGHYGSRVCERAKELFEYVFTCACNAEVHSLYQVLCLFFKAQGKQTS